MPSKVAVRIIKLGGSLLYWPEWPARFRRWLSEQPTACNILIAGGGSLADEIRDRDRTVGLDPSTAHWLAIDAMCTNIVAVRQLLSEAVSAYRWEDLHTPIASQALVAFCPRDFLMRIEPRAAGPRLPHSWDATSDSIAARLADVLGAQELVLLKSALPEPPVTTLQQAADAGYVDRCLPQFASRLRAVRCCNLRNDKLAEWGTVDEEAQGRPPTTSPLEKRISAIPGLVARLPPQNRSRL
jgi:5-(aminomethyl)-3-furanmethanol phosphate kinase